MSEYKKVIISPNKLTLPDGRILAKFIPDWCAWELLHWYKGRYIGSEYISTSQEDKIINEAMLDGCWVDCLECMEARRQGEALILD